MLTAAILALASLAAAAQAAPDAARAIDAARCTALAGIALADVRIEVAQPIAAGIFQGPDGMGHAVPAFCRVRGEARPSPASQIGFELWMPAAGWNGRYYQLGNGGFAGGISYRSLAAELRRLNAVAATDTGHRAGPFDASWALGQPEKVVDFGYRSLKVTADAAARLIAAHYARGPQRRYFVGCSNGGRQALMVAQRYPADWDGVLAGAPAHDFIRQLVTTAWIQQRLRERSESWLPATKLAAIERAAVASCGDSAQRPDALPRDPRQCPFDPAVLACRDGDHATCLTAPQVDVVRAIQSGPPPAGSERFYGFEPTGATVDNDWAELMLNEQPHPASHQAFAEQFFRYMVFDDPAWTIASLDAARALAAARARPVAGESLGRVLEALDPDLAPFERRGGRLLMYFGWADALLAPRAALEYYERVTAALGSVERVRGFFRLFMVPGMGHCQGGPAPHAFGQAGIVPGRYDDAAHDARRALERWVESGEPPERLVAVKFNDDDPARGIAATRALCPWPQMGDC